MPFNNVVPVSFPDDPVRAPGLESLQQLIFFRVLHLVLVTDLPASTGSLPPDLNIWYSDLLAGVLILNVLEFLITGAVSLIRYEFTHQDVALILNVLDVIFSSPVYSWQWCVFSLYVKQAYYDVILSVTNSTSIFLQLLCCSWLLVMIWFWN